MRPTGFSTGALAKSDFRHALAMQDDTRFRAVELSALRESEIDDLVASIPSMDLKQYEYVSFHAPSSLDELTEAELVSRLKCVADLGMKIVVHPDVIRDFETWRPIGHALLLENMDQRKPTGRTVAELTKYFDELPDAGFCFDIGHARQVDPTMGVAVELLVAFSDRLQELHVSEVNEASKHVAMSTTCVMAFERIASLIRQSVPAIIESVISEDGVAKEFEKVSRCLGPAQNSNRTNGVCVEKKSIGA